MIFHRLILLFVAALIGCVCSAPIPSHSLAHDADAHPVLSKRVLQPHTVSHAKPSLKHAAQAVIIKHKIDKAFNPKHSESVFWSGGVPGGSVKPHAQKHAEDRGKKTINHALEEAGIHIPEPTENPHSLHLWTHASALWAQKAHGRTEAVLGSVVRDDGIYKTVEKPILMQNKQVTKLVEYNAHTGKSQQVKPSRWCPSCIIA